MISLELRNENLRGTVHINFHLLSGSAVGQVSKIFVLKVKNIQQNTPAGFLRVRLRALDYQQDVASASFATRSEQLVVIRNGTAPLPFLSSFLMTLLRMSAT